MSLKTQRGLRNALLQRVRRHALIATIFRAADPIPSSETSTWEMGSFNNSEAQKGADLVQATLLSSNIEPSRPTRPDTNSVVVRRPPSAEPFIQKTSAPYAQFESPQPVDHDFGPEGTYSPDDSDTDDPAWRQLKTIYRKHQEKNAYKGSTDRTNKPTPNPAHRELQTQNIPDAGDKAGNPQPPKLTSDPVSIRDRLGHDLDTSGKQEITSQSDSDSGFQGLKEQNDQHIHTFPDGFMVDTQKSYPKDEFDSQTDQQQRSPTDSGLQIKDKEDVRIEPDLSLNNFVEDSSSREDDDPDPSLHTVPLEAVWPVQKQDCHPEPKKPPIEGAENPAITTHSRIPDPQAKLKNMVGIDAIHKALRNVIPNQPTSSSIEIITPRRPRPQSQTIVKRKSEERSSKRSDTGTQTTSQGSRSSQTNLNRNINSNQEIHAGSGLDSNPERKPVKSQHISTSNQPVNNSETSQDNQYIEHPDQPLQDGAAVLLQGFPKKPGSDSEIDNESDPDLIQTEIGPLPVDLWEILGHRPPSSPGQDGVIPESPPMPTGPKTNIQRAEASPVDKNLSPRRHTSEKQIFNNIEEGSIQRTVTTDDDLSVTPNSSSSETTSESTADSETSQQSDPDIDELSRRVYAEIRRQLSVEWERSRKRS
jgi:hypothetical protein